MADILVIVGAAFLRRVSFYETIRTPQRMLFEMSDPIPESAVSEDGSPVRDKAQREALMSLPTSPSSPSSPRISRHPSFSGSSSYQEDWEAIPPLDKIGVFDLLDTFAFPQQLEKLQHTLVAQKEKVKRQRDAIKSRSSYAKERVVEEWRRRVPSSEEQLDKYRKRMSESVDRLGRRWHDTKAVTMREKFAFIGGVLNIFISGYLIGRENQQLVKWSRLTFFVHRWLS